MGDQPSFSEQRQHARGAFGAIIEGLAGPPARKPLAERIVAAMTAVVIVTASLSLMFGLGMACLVIWDVVTR